MSILKEYVLRIKSLDKDLHLTLFFILIALALGGGAGILVGLVNNPLYIIIGLIGLIAFVIAFSYAELGLVFFIFITYTRFSDVAVHYHNVPSVAKSFVVLLLVVVMVRWAIFNEKPEKWHKAAILIGSYGLVGFSSLLYATSTERVWESFADFIKDALIAIVIVLMLKKGVAFRQVLWSLLIAGIFIGSISVFQFLTGTFLNNYGGFAQASIMQIVSESNDFRISGPIGDPNFFAQVMVVLVPIALERMLHEKTLFLRFLAGWGLVVSALSVVFTYSRGGFLSLTVTLVLLFFIYPPKPSRMPFFLLAIIIVMSMIPAQYYNRILSINEFFESSGNGFRSDDLAIRGRTSEVFTALAMIKDHPFLGVGLNNYAFLYEEYSKSIGLAPTVSERSAHNLYLEVTSETGALGLAVFGVLLWVTWRTLIVSRKKLISNGIFDYAAMVTGFSVGLIGYLLAAIFVHSAYPRYFYLLVGIGFAIENITNNLLDEKYEMRPG